MTFVDLQPAAQRMTRLIEGIGAASGQSYDCDEASLEAPRQSRARQSRSGDS